MDKVTKYGFYTMIILLIAVVVAVSVTWSQGIPEQAYADGVSYRGSSSMSEGVKDGSAEMLSFYFVDGEMIHVLFGMNISTDTYEAKGNNLVTDSDTYVYNASKKSFSVTLEDGDVLCYVKEN